MWDEVGVNGRKLRFESWLQIDDVSILGFS